MIRFAAREADEQGKLTEVEKRLSPQGNLSSDFELNPNYDEMSAVDRRLSTKKNLFYQNQKGVEQRDYQEIKEKLTHIKKGPLTREDIAFGWPKEVEGRLNKLIQARRDSLVNL